MVENLSLATPTNIKQVEAKPGKEITIKFIQDSNKQCFITDYNICVIENASEAIKKTDEDLKSRLVIDANSQSVTDNIQNLSKIVTANCQSPSQIGSSGGYDAMKRSRSVGTKRKTIRQAKHHARRSRRSRPSRFSI